MIAVVEDYYINELFKFMPEEMFDLLDEAWFSKKTEVQIPDYLIEEYEKNKLKS